MALWCQCQLPRSRIIVRLPCFKMCSEDCTGHAVRLSLRCPRAAFLAARPPYPAPGKAFQTVILRDCANNCAMRGKQTSKA
jgi:hypothetical protein